MPDDTTVTGQPEQQAADTQYPDDSLPDDSAAEQPSETQNAEEESPEAESAESAEVEETEASEDEPTEPTSSMDEYLATLTPEERAYYAKRYPTAWKLANDPNQADDVRALLRDKINGDFDIKKFRAAQEEEPTLEEDSEPEETAEAAQPTDQAEQRKQYYQQIDDIVAKQIDPQAVNEMGSQLLAAMGVDLQSKDPEIQAIVKNAPKVGQVLSRGAIDLIATVLPNLLATRMESAFPNFTRMYDRAVHGEVWQQIRETQVKGQDGQPSKPYEKLPAYGTPQFQAAIDKAIAEIPKLNRMTFVDDYGRPLPNHLQIAEKYKLVAKAMTGQQVNPAAIAQAVDTGKKLADKAKITRNAGRALGAGRSTQQIGQQNAEEDDPVMADLDRAIASANSALNPFAKPKR